MKKELIRAFLLKGDHGTEIVIAQDVEDRCVRYFKVEELDFEAHGELLDKVIKENEK